MIEKLNKRIGELIKSLWTGQLRINFFKGKILKVERKEEEDLT